MPRVQRLDISPVHKANGWLPPPSLPVREPAQVLDRREDHPWPFLFSYQGNTVIVNKAKPATKYQEANEVGVALF